MLRGTHCFSHMPRNGVTLASRLACFALDPPTAKLDPACLADAFYGPLSRWASSSRHSSFFFGPREFSHAQKPQNETSAVVEGSVGQDPTFIAT